MARKRGNKWQASVTDANGKRHRPAFDTEAQAVAWEGAANLAVDEGRALPPISTGKAGNRDLALLGSLFEHVKRTHWAGMKSASTANLNAKTVVEYFGEKKPVADIGSADIAEMRADLADRGLTHSTINRKCAALSKMLHVALDAGVINKMPRIRFSKEEQTKFRYVDELEERAILAYWLASGDQDLHDLSEFLIDTGARCYSEAMDAKWDAFAKGFTSVTFWHTKTSKPRTVPLTRRVRDTLARRWKTHQNRAGPFTGGSKDTMRGRWSKMRSGTGLHDVTPHTLRHTCCTRLINAGVDIKRVMTWMGHTELTTTLRYMQIRPNGLDDIVALLERPHEATGTSVQSTQRRTPRLKKRVLTPPPPFEPSWKTRQA
ncbi:integrase [Mesorhizobium sp. LNJC384A00]|uniref:tyrosine-type recombinase/integrase n=1 Tax=Mesorhizobium sp. LNJC384A00 TaxID=1287268 RepID=UPI0003CE1BBE|nr:site-specific integrase [Mesorhizobium sp. LNJC384A00]ESY41881.1 integrase [Mesorhizobium sp. LNJC384A00]